MDTAPAAAPPAMDLDTATRDLNAHIEIDLDALEANVAAIRAATGPGVEFMAVVKANAYGHGLGVIAPLDALPVDRFCTVHVGEALQVRKAGATRPILVLGHAFPADAGLAVAHNLTLTVHSLELGQAIAAEARAAGHSVPVHVKVDTGLHRFGVAPEEAITLAEALRHLPGLEVEGLWTHLANADETDDRFSDQQRTVFDEVRRALWWVPFHHAANSATALRRPDLRYHGVRVGLAMHGLLPENTPDPGLRPVMQLKARIARVSDVPEGEGVSYGLTWRAGRPSRVALVPVGYADGWTRSLGNASEVIVGGRRCPVVGRVCMDHFTVDVTEVPDAREGAVAVLIGGQGTETITAAEVARWSDTISYEVISTLTARLPRVYHRSGLVG